MDSVETLDPAVANKTLTSFWMASSFLTVPHILPTTNLSCNKAGIHLHDFAFARVCDGDSRYLIHDVPSPEMMA